MSNEKEHYVLHCGKLQYEVTPEVQKTLEGVMYWTHCEKLDRQELAWKEKDERFGADVIAQLRHDIKQAHLTIGDLMTKMEEQGVPNWVGNGAMEWARNNDLREHSSKEFFEKSVYAREQRTMVTERKW